MPFSVPQQFASAANTGYLATFLIGTLASPPVYTSIAEIKSFAPDWISMAEIPTTHLLSLNNTEEFIPSLIKPGKVTFSGNFISDTTQLNITTLAQAQSIFPFKILAPMRRNVSTYTATGNGFISNYKNGPFEVNKAVEFMVEIQMTGAYVETFTA